MKIQDLLQEGLVGGTCVEYKDHCGFDLVFGRGTITKAALEGEMFVVRTDNNDECHMDVNVSPVVEAMGFTSETQKQGDLFLVRSSMGWCYALARRGIPIPERPHWMSVTNEEYAKTIKRVCEGK